MRRLRLLVKIAASQLCHLPSRLHGKRMTLIGKITNLPQTHRVVFRFILPKQLLAAYETLGKNYVVELESTRRPLPMFTTPYPLHAGEQWLELVPMSMIKGLADAFFSVFNPFTPIMDKSYFFSFTVGSALESGFGYSMESCIVLTVMALGCQAVLAHQEGNYPLPGATSHRFEAPEWMNVVYEEQPGLRFFNEARRRIGFLMCDNDIQSCQFYLLSSCVNPSLRSMIKSITNSLQCIL